MKEGRTPVREVRAPTLPQEAREEVLQVRTAEPVPAQTAHVEAFKARDPPCCRCGVLFADVGVFVDDCGWSVR